MCYNEIRIEKGRNYSEARPNGWVFMFFDENPPRGGIRICFRSVDFPVCPS
jgi:hypothetical protein